MSEMVDVISSEFEEALEVRNPKSLHRGIFLLLSSTINKEEHITEHSGLRDSVDLMGHSMGNGFIRMDEHFKRMDEKFERMDKLGQQMYRFMIWSFGTAATASGIIIAVLKLS